MPCQASLESSHRMIFRWEDGLENSGDFRRRCRPRQSVWEGLPQNNLVFMIFEISYFINLPMSETYQDVAWQFICLSETRSWGKPEPTALCLNPESILPSPISTAQHLAEPHASFLTSPNSNGKSASGLSYAYKCRCTVSIQIWFAYLIGLRWSTKLRQAYCLVHLPKGYAR